MIPGLYECIQHSRSPSLPFACRDRLSPPGTNRTHISPRRVQTGRTSLPVAYKPDAHLSPSRTNRAHISPRRVQTGRTSLPRAPAPPTLPRRTCHTTPRPPRHPGQGTWLYSRDIGRVNSRGGGGAGYLVGERLNRPCKHSPPPSLHPPPYCCPYPCPYCTLTPPSLLLPLPMSLLYTPSGDGGVPR